MPVAPELYPYQERGMQMVDEFNGVCLISDEMGLGKTCTSLHWCKIQPYLRPVVVVCPASLKYIWEREAQKHVDMSCHILNGKTPTKWKPYPEPQIYIINYDILGGWVEWLKELKPQIIIFDESHMLQSRDSKRTKHARALAKDIPYRIALSGTPLINKPADLWPTLNILRPDLYPTFFPFAQRFCSPQRTPWGWKYDGAVRLGELHAELKKNLLIRRRKDQVLKQLPKKSRMVLPVDIDKPKEYRLAESQFLTWLQKEAPHKVKRAMMAEKLVQLGYLKRLAGKLKLRPVLEWINSFCYESEDKLIVFGVHKAVISEIQSYYAKNCVVVDGSVTDLKRQKAFDRFNNEKNCWLFIGNIQAAGTGWGATNCSTVLFAELDWTPGKHIQAESRVHGISRGDKDKPANIFYMVGRNTIEEDLCEIIQTKAVNANKTIDGQDLVEDMNVLDLLEQKLMRRINK